MAYGGYSSVDQSSPAYQSYLAYMAGGGNPTMQGGNQATAMQTGGQTGYETIMQGMPSLEKAAYTTSGLEGLYTNPELGQVPQATMDAYWNPALADAYKKSKGAYASLFGEAGMPAKGVGGQAEMLSRRAGELNIARAGSNMENAARGATTRAGTQANIGTNRYRVMTDPLETYYKMQLGAGAGSSLARAAGGSTGGGGVRMGEPSGYSVAGSQTPWWQTSGQNMTQPVDTWGEKGWNQTQSATPGFSAGQTYTPQLSDYLKQISMNYQAD